MVFWLPTLPPLSPLLALSLPLSHTLPIYLCAPTWFTTTFSPVRLPLSAAMFDLISSKLSSVSTENTSVSFPASLSVTVLAALPSLSLSLCLYFSLCVLFLKGAQLTHPTGCPSLQASHSVCLPCQLLLILIHIHTLLPLLPPLPSSSLRCLPYSRMLFMFNLFQFNVVLPRDQPACVIFCMHFRCARTFYDKWH